MPVEIANAQVVLCRCISSFGCWAEPFYSFVVVLIEEPDSFHVPHTQCRHAFDISKLRASGYQVQGFSHRDYLGGLAAHNVVLGVANQVPCRRPLPQSATAVRSKSTALSDRFLVPARAEGY